MKRIAAAAAVLLAVGPVLAVDASAGTPSTGSWSYTDYTPDVAALAGTVMLHAVTGANVSSFCAGGRVPSAPQDVNAHQLTVSKPSVLTIHVSSSGYWGVDVSSRGRTLATAGTSPTSSTADLKVRVARGTYSVAACNLGGAPTATATYRLVRTR